MSFYQRNLPHWQPDGAEYFITFRLTGSLPKAVVQYLRKYRKELEEGRTDQQTELQVNIQRKIFRKYETILDKGESGPVWLAHKPVANLVREALHHRDKSEYDLYAYCIMSNHVHLVFRLLSPGKSSENASRLSDYPVTKVMKKMKSYTAVQANKILKRNGTFWHHESYDRVIRDAGELGSVNTICMSLRRRPCFVQTRRRECAVAARTAATGNAVWRNRDPALRVAA